MTPRRNPKKLTLPTQTESGRIKLTWPIGTTLNMRVFYERALRQANALGLQGMEVVDVQHEKGEPAEHVVLCWRRVAQRP